MKININIINEQAIEEFTEIIKKITLISNKISGGTGFLYAMEEHAKKELLKFIKGDE